MKKKVNKTRPYAIPLGRDMYLLKGPNHSEGGIDLGKVEAEGNEVMQIKPKEVRFFSKHNIGGEVPAKQVLNGENPDNVFNRQENYKDRKGLNDDGTKKALGGEDNTRSYFNWLNKQAKRWNTTPLEVSSHPYNYLGFYRENPNRAYAMLEGNPDAHFTDTYKTAKHPTFSEESKYSSKKSYYNPKGIKGGKWSEDGKSYTLSEDQVNNNWNVDKTVDYVGIAEPNGFNGYYPDGSKWKLSDGVRFERQLPRVTAVAKRKKKALGGKEDEGLGYIGGSTNDARNTWLNNDRILLQAVSDISNRYGISPQLVIDRMKHEGVIDKNIYSHNSDSFEYISSPNDPILKGTYHKIPLKSILNSTNDPYQDWGLDTVFDSYTKGNLKIKRPIQFEKSTAKNESGEIVNSGITDNNYDNLELFIAELASRQNQVKKDYPNLSNEDLMAATSARFNAGNRYFKKMMKDGTFRKYRISDNIKVPNPREYKNKKPNSTYQSPEIYYKPDSYIEEQFKHNPSLFEYKGLGYHPKYSKDANIYKEVLDSARHKIAKDSYSEPELGDYEYYNPYIDKSNNFKMGGNINKNNNKMNKVYSLTVNGKTNLKRLPSTGKVLKTKTTKIAKLGKRVNSIKDILSDIVDNRSLQERNTYGNWDSTEKLDFKGVNPLSDITKEVKTTKYKGSYDIKKDRPKYTDRNAYYRSNPHNRNTKTLKYPTKTVNKKVNDDVLKNTINKSNNYFNSLFDKKPTTKSIKEVLDKETVLPEVTITAKRKYKNNNYIPSDTKMTNDQIREHIKNGNKPYTSGKRKRAVVYTLDDGSKVQHNTDGTFSRISGLTKQTTTQPKQAPATNNTTSVNNTPKTNTSIPSRTKSTIPTRGRKKITNPTDSMNMLDIIKGEQATKDRINNSRIGSWTRNASIKPEYLEGDLTRNSSSSVTSSKSSNSNTTSVPYRPKQESKFVNKYKTNKDKIDDYIGLGSNVLSSLIGFGSNLAHLNRMKYVGQPKTKIANKLKTTININPQVDKMRETLATYNRDIDASTKSSAVALNRKRKGMMDYIGGYNQLYGTKENMETELINKDKLNQQTVANANVDAYNTWAEKKNAFENNIRDLKSENAIGLISGINSGVQDFITRRQKRRADKRNSLLIAAGNPNTNPRILKSFIPNLYSDEEVARWERNYRR